MQRGQRRRRKRSAAQTLRKLAAFGATCSLLVGTAQAPLAWADGFRNPFHDSGAIAQGNAFRAQADNPSAVFYNPAGMSQLSGIQNTAGAQLVSPSTAFTSPTGVTVDNSVEGGTVGFPPPGQFFLTANLGYLGAKALRDVTVGFGVLNLFGFANEYPENGPFATAITRAQLPLLNLKPTVAYQVNESLSLGLGADIFTFASFLGEGQFERQSIAAGNIPGTVPGDELELNGTGTTAGLNASALVTWLRNADNKPLLNVGVVWRSQAVLPLDGSLLANGQKIADVSTSVRFPESYEWGLAWWPIRDRERAWKTEVDVAWVRWSSIRDFDISLSNGVVLPNPQDWDDSVNIGVGTEYMWLNPPAHPDWQYAVRVGYNRSPTPVPDKNFDPAFADSDINVFTVGVGFSCEGKGRHLWLIQCGDVGEGALWRKGMGLDLAYMAILFEERTVTRNPNPGVNGTYETTNHAGSVTFRVNF